MEDMMNQDKNSATENEKRTGITSRQIVAMAGVILLVLLYAATLVIAIVDGSSSGRLFWICLFATIAIPILIWVYTWMYGKLTGRKTMANLDFSAGKEESAEAPKPESPAQAGEHQA